MRVLYPILILISWWLLPGSSVLHAKTQPKTTSGLIKKKHRDIDSLKQRLQQAIPDTLYAQYLEQIAKLYYHLQADSSLAFRENAIEFCKNKGLPDCWEENTHKKAILLINQGRLIEAEQNLKRVLVHCEATGNRHRYGSVKIHLAWLKNKAGHLGESLQLYLQALEVKEAINDWAGQSDIYNRLGLLYLEWLSPKRALVNFEKAIAIGRAHDKKGMYTAALYNAARSYMMIDDTAQARTHYEEYIERRLEQKSIRSLGYVFAAKAQLARIQTDTLNELRLLDSALVHYFKRHLYPGAANGLMRKSRIFLAQGQYLLATRIAQQALQTAVDASHHRTMVGAHALLAACYSTQQQFSQAYFHLKQNHILRDSFYDSITAEQLASLEDHFWEKQKEQALRLLTTTNELSTLKLQKKQTQQYYLSTLLLFAILVIALIVFQLRQKQRSNQSLHQAKNRAEEALEQKGFLVREIHHRVKNNLQVVASLLRLQTRYIKDQTALEAIEEGRNRVRSMSLIHQYLYQEDQPQQIPLATYVEQLTQSLFRSYNIAPERIRLHLEIQAPPIDIDLAIQVGLIINELITNALKYAFPPEQHGQISVLLSSDDQTLTLQVQDNGIGATQVVQQEGFGYQLLKALCRRLQAQLSIEQNNGTIVTIEIPVTQALMGTHDHSKPNLKSTF